MDDSKSYLELQCSQAVDFLQEPYDQIWEDSAHQHLVVRIGRGFHVASLVPSPSSGLISLSGPRYEELPASGQSLGSTVLGVRFSLDFKLLAIQLIPTLVKVVDLVHSKDWNVKIRSSKHNVILQEGVLWSDHAGSSQDLILVTARGMELYKVNVAKSTCRFSRSVDIPIHNFWYEPKHRVIVLSCGDLGTKMRIYFLIRDAKSALPQFELPPPEKAPSFFLDEAPEREDVALQCLYGAPHTLVLNKKLWELDVYRLTKSQTEKVRRLNLLCNVPLSPSKKTNAPSQPAFRFSFSDNLVVVHSIYLGRSLVYDIEDQPVNKSTGLSSKESVGLLNPLGSVPMAVAYHPASVGTGSDEMEEAQAIYSGSWPLLWPHHVLDVTNSKLWVLGLDLETLANHLKPATRLAAFLQRRGMPNSTADPAPLRDPSPSSSSLGSTRSATPPAVPPAPANMMPLPPMKDVEGAPVNDVGAGIGRTAKDLILTSLSEMLEARAPLQSVSSYLQLLMGPYVRASSNPMPGVGPNDSDVFEGMDQSWTRNSRWQLEPRGGFGYFAVPLSFAIHPVFKELQAWGEQMLYQQDAGETEKDSVANFGFIHPDLMGQPEFWPGFARREPPRCPKGMLVVLQCDIFAGVFLPLLTDKKEHQDYRYLASALLELVFICSRANVKLEPYIAVAVIGLLLAPQPHGQKGSVERVVQVLSSRFLPDSLELALCLVHMGSSWPLLKSFTRAGLDMLHRLKQWKLLMSELLHNGYFEEACCLWNKLFAENDNLRAGLPLENHDFSQCAIQKLSAAKNEEDQQGHFNSTVLHNAYLFSLRLQQDSQRNDKRNDDISSTMLQRQNVQNVNNIAENNVTSPFSLPTTNSDAKLNFPIGLVQDPEVAERLAMLWARKAADSPYVEENSSSKQSQL